MNGLVKRIYYLNFGSARSMLNVNVNDLNHLATITNILVLKLLAYYYCSPPGDPPDV